MGTRAGGLFLLLSYTHWPVEYGDLPGVHYVGHALFTGARRLFLVRTPLFTPGDWAAALALLDRWTANAPAWRLGPGPNLEAALGLSHQELDSDLWQKLSMFHAKSARHGLVQRLGEPRSERGLQHEPACALFPHQVRPQDVVEVLQRPRDSSVGRAYVVEDVPHLLRLLPLAAGRPALHRSLRRMVLLSRRWLELRVRQPVALLDVPLLLVPLD